MKSISKITRKLNEKLMYPFWINKNEPTLEELDRQKKEKFLYSPKISIVCPLFNTPESYLRDMVNSVLNQTYSNIELCLADASNNEVNLERAILAYKDQRIVYKRLEVNSGIAENTNEAIALATGEYIGFLDHDDVLAPFAIFEVVKTINENIGVDFIYSDEDKFTKGMRSRKDPFFKPGFSPHYLYGLNYICHFVVAKRSLVDGIGGLRGEYNGSQDYDFVLRATNKAKKVMHIPKVLYHWRVHKDSVSHAASAKTYTINAGQKAVRNFFQEKLHKEQVEVECINPNGRYSASYQLDRDKVTIIIYNDDNTNLGKCVRSIKRQKYSNIEIVIVGKKPDLEYAYVDSDTLGIFEALNKGSKQAEGEYLMFMHSSLELVQSDHIQKLLTYAQLPVSGAVGGKIIDSKLAKIRAMGVIIGRNGDLEFAHKGENIKESLYYDIGILPHNVSAIPFCGMLTKKEHFIKQNGFSTHYILGGSDIEYCLRLRERDLLITCVPGCELGIDKDFDTFKFSDQDLVRLKQKYQSFFECDIYYSKSFTRSGKGYRI